MSLFEPDDDQYPAVGSARARLTGQRQAAQARAELQRQRHARIQAANDAADHYMRRSGTRDYPLAFLHVQRTRPELFGDAHVSVNPVGRQWASVNHY